MAAETNSEGAKALDLVDDTPKVQADNEPTVEDPKHLDTTEENPMPSSEQEEEVIKKKYGGLIPKKTPLISKDHERAFFDSADWALGKQGAQKSKGPLEALRPKLQPTPHQQVRSRRSAYAPADGGEVEGGDANHTASEVRSSELEAGHNDDTHSKDQIGHD